MGTWGYKVGESDTFHDVYDFFFDSYNQGHSPEEASNQVLEELSDYFSDHDDKYEAYLALAFAQWETQHKDAAVSRAVKRFISSGESLENWTERGGDEALLDERRSALLSFLSKISKPRRSKKRRVRKIPDFNEIILVELMAPDGRKVLTVQENHADGRFLHTLAMIMWASGGGSIFHSDRSGLEIAAEWLDSQNLKISILNAVKNDLIFAVGDPNSAFYSGDRVALIYEYSG